jgi:hypothetical protein
MKIIEGERIKRTTTKRKEDVKGGKETGNATFEKLIQKKRRGNENK